MKQIKGLLFLLIFIASSTTFSQKSAIYSNDLEDFQRAVNLYKNNQYQSAQIIFDKVKANNDNADKPQNNISVMPISPVDVSELSGYIVFVLVN